MGLNEAISRAALERADRLMTCSTCGNRYDPDNISETHPFRHPVNGGLVNKPAQQDADMAAKGSGSLPSDPILRLVLIEKGIITVEDLDRAEAKLRASGMIIAESRGTTEGSQHPMDCICDGRGIIPGPIGGNAQKCPGKKAFKQERMGDWQETRRTCDFCGSVMPAIETYQDERLLPRTGHKSCVSEALNDLRDPDNRR